VGKRCRRPSRRQVPAPAADPEPVPVSTSPSPVPAPPPPSSIPLSILLDTSRLPQLRVVLGVGVQLPHPGLEEVGWRQRAVGALVISPNARSGDDKASYDMRHGGGDGGAFGCKDSMKRGKRSDAKPSGPRGGGVRSTAGNRPSCRPGARRGEYHGKQPGSRGSSRHFFRKILHAGWRHRVGWRNELVKCLDARSRAAAAADHVDKSTPPHVAEFMHTPCCRILRLGELLNRRVHCKRAHTT